MVQVIILAAIKELDTEMVNVILVSSAGGTTLPGWPPKPDNTAAGYDWIIIPALALAVGVYLAVRKVRANRKGD